METLEQVSNAEQFLDYVIFAEFHVAAALFQVAQSGAAAPAADAGVHGKIDSDFSGRNGAMGGDHVLERRQFSVQCLETAVKGFFQCAVRVDCIDEEIGAAVCKRGQCMKEKLVVRFCRSMIIQCDTA